MKKTAIPEKVLKKIINVVLAEPSVDQVWLFGSRARGDHKYNSDIDILLVGQDIPLHVNTRLRHAAGLYKLDLVKHSEITSDDFAEEVDNDKILIYDRELTASSS